MSYMLKKNRYISFLCLVALYNFSHFFLYEYTLSAYSRLTSIEVTILIENSQMLLVSIESLLKECENIFPSYKVCAFIQIMSTISTIVACSSLIFCDMIFFSNEFIVPLPLTIFPYESILSFQENARIGFSFLMENFDPYSGGFHSFITERLSKIFHYKIILADQFSSPQCYMLKEENLVRTCIKLDKYYEITGFLYLYGDKLYEFMTSSDISVTRNYTGYDLRLFFESFSTFYTIGQFLSDLEKELAEDL